MSSSGDPSSSRGPRPIPNSSAAFLHHLHTDPSSHHVTLAGSPSNTRHAAASQQSSSLVTAPSRSPPSITIPLDPTVEPRNRTVTAPPEGLPNSPHDSPNRRTQALAGPSTLKSLARTPSRKGRPQTAPSAREVNELPISGSEHTPSPEMSTSRRSSVQHHTLADSPDESRRSGEARMLSATDQGPAPEGDSCIAAFAREEAGLEDALGMLSVASSSGAGDSGPSGEGGTILLGRAGSLAGTSGSPQQRTTALSPSEVETPSWKTFSNAYALGLFDPNKIPNPPRLSRSPHQPYSSSSSPGVPFGHTAALVARQGYDGRIQTSSSTGSRSTNSSNSVATMSTSATSAPSTSAANESPAKASSMAAAIAARRKGKSYEVEMMSRNMDPASRPQEPIIRPDHLNLPSYSLAAATVRMASHHLQASDFAPLGMPSPERELVDPLASALSPESANTVKDSASSDPGGTRFPLSRSMSSAVPGSHLLPTIAASPVGTPVERSPNSFSSSFKGKSPASRLGGALQRHIPPASAPLEKTLEAESTTDYFGTASPPPQGGEGGSSAGNSSSNQTAHTTPQAPQASTPEPRRPPSFDASPDMASSNFRAPSMAAAHEIGPLYERLGWLPAPIPSNELARRRALYRFNILHTAPDTNFDRIAHMTKLVFHAKIVLIALIDADSQWHKTQSGLGAEEAARISSFCSHSILARTDEPFVVLDATQDWRFANNPQVVGPPYIRFYAGAPLRTADGLNLGSLCIIDDKPRDEFPPRSRLILKEFAAVVMREMELWRDKLQLRVRDKIQTSMEKFTRECLEMESTSSASSSAATAAKMDHVYARAAQLVCSTLDLDGSFILDIGQFEQLEVEDESSSGAETTKTIYRADPYFAETQSPVLERKDGFAPIGAFPVLATTPTPVPVRGLTAEEHERFSDFLLTCKDGKIFEHVAPSWIRYMFPVGFRYGMVVPIFGVDHQPFAMVCAYTTNKSKQFLEGYELQFLRAIGVIILSAVLRRRMVLADKTKSVLISSVSHELRTPLHGILAAAELLSDTKLDSNQISFLKTVQTCGNSLIETVNHVLDFTKLSGSTQSASGSSIRLGKVNLAQLVEQTVEGCWIGQRARFFMGDSEIGSFYAPPAPASGGKASRIAAAQEAGSGAKAQIHVETVIDIAQREKGWMVRCERGGLRRVLMNLVGNSLKFTKDGYVQVTLRELPHEPGAKQIPIEMAVIDTGKGIGKEFLKSQLFHPFSQENPLQTGTGLGLAIVNSIVRSENVNGKVDVWSMEGMGTEIRVSFDVETIDDEDDTSSNSSFVSLGSSVGRGHSISLLQFDETHRGHMLSLEVLGAYAAAWLFELKGDGQGDILVVNEDEQYLSSLQDSAKPIIFLLSLRTSSANDLRDAVNEDGGFCQILYKPVGPSAFRSALQAAVDYITGDTKEDSRPSMSRGDSGVSNESQESNSTISELSHIRRFDKPYGQERAPLQRRRSEETDQQHHSARPSMAPRGMTYHHAPPSKRIASSEHSDGVPSPLAPGSPTSTISTISLADGGVMLKAATLPPEAPRTTRVPRVMVVEDNIINRRVLGAFLKKKGFEFAEAVDGQAGVELFESTPPNHWDVILMDISMPVMNGHEATRAIRKIEFARKGAAPTAESASSSPGASSLLKIPPPKVVQARAKVFALTGLATSDDKREAFVSGVDGYLVKPVSLASLDLIFKKIGFA